MKSADDIERLAKKIRIKTSDATRERILSDAEAALVSSTKKGPEVSRPGPVIWRTIMKSKITKLAAAAVIIIAVFIVIHQLGGSVESTAFADVVRPLLTAETGTFKMTIDVVSSGLDWIDCGDERFQTIEVMFAGSGRTRWNVPTGEVLVANMQEGKVMILIPAKKQAAVMQVGPPGVIPPHNRFNKLLELRPIVEYALERQGDCVKYLGGGQIDGVAVVGYRIPGPPHHGDITFWADVKTRLPIRIEQSMDMPNRKETAVIADIVYDIEPDESLFRVEPPEEYSVGSPDEDKEPEFVVTGTVTDTATGQPIAGAKVSDGEYAEPSWDTIQAGDCAPFGAITDSAGKYRYLTWGEHHSVEARAAGYKTQHKSIKAGLFHTDNVGDKQVIDFALELE